MSNFEIKSLWARRCSRLSLLAVFVMAFAMMLPSSAQAAEGGEKEAPLDVKGIMFEHLGDAYGWEVPFSHTNRIPLPVIVRAEDGSWHCFSSGDLTQHVEHDGHKALEPVVKSIDKNGSSYCFLIAHASTHKDKVVQIFPLSDAERSELDSKLAEVSRTGDGQHGAQVIDGYVYYNGQYYREFRPLDLSITKNVAALFIAALLVVLMVFSLVRFYRRNGLSAPRKGMGFFEMLVGFVYYDTIKAALGSKTRKFAPYLMTVFFFILVMNIVGLVVIFPGGANLTGNIAATLVLALCTFVVTNVFGSKHYWKDIFWPDVPMFLKFPLPIMQLIEVFGIFTKPAALCVRLFANMMGGHMIVITLTMLIFILGSFGAGVVGTTTVVSVLFTLFMLLLDVLVSFIQAYVFTLLSSLFISMAQAGGEHEEKPQVESK